MTRAVSEPPLASVPEPQIVRIEPGVVATAHGSSRLRAAATRADTALLRLPTLRVPRVLEPSHPRSPLWTWVVTRLVVLMAIGFAEENVVGDVTYYGRALSGLFHGVPVRETLQEYPFPVLGVLLPQFLVGGLNPLAFALLFVASMLAVDAAFTRHLLRVRRERDPAAAAGTHGAVAFWIWFVPLMGPIAYFRFDLLPAVAAGAAITAAFVRPSRSGVLTAIGAGLKLWPAALLPTFLVRRSGRRAALTGFTVSGVVILGVSAVLGGVTRLISPLQWQSERGLQIESIFAAPLMIARAVHPHHVWTVKVSRFKAWEIYGAGSHLLVTVSTAATFLAVAWLVWIWYRAFRLGTASAALVGWLVFVTVALMTVVNKTLSPQYLIWLGGPLAAMLLEPRRDAVLRRVTVLMLVVAGLTQLIFPLTYNWMLHTSWTMPVTVTLLVVRNALLVWITWLACREAWRLTARPATAVAVPGDDVVPVTATGELQSVGGRPEPVADLQP